MKKEKLEEGAGGGVEEEYHSGQLWVEREQNLDRFLENPNTLQKTAASNIEY